MKKLYLATKVVTTMFVFDNDVASLEAEAKNFLLEEDSLRSPEFAFPITIKEITTVDQIPQDWLSDAYVWGDDNDTTPKAFLEKQKGEYAEFLKLEKEYLKLKEKFKTPPVDKNTCTKCNNTGFIHKSIYALGPGYFDEPDPDVYCDCPKGKWVKR